MRLKKGTIVEVKTTNGGEIISTLVQDYRPTYDAVVHINERPVAISANRLKSVESVMP